MEPTNSPDGATAQADVLDTTQVVMRMPLMAPQSSGTPAASKEATAPSQSAQAEAALLDWKHPIVLQVAIGAGCVVIIVAAYWLLTSFGSSDSPSPEKGLRNESRIVADSSQPVLQSSPSAFNDSFDAIADEQNFQSLPPGPSLTGPETEARQPTDDFRVDAAPSTPHREPTPIDAIELNPATADQTPLTRTQRPTPATFASESTGNGDYPTTSPKRWRYPEYEIRTPTPRDYPPPRFADRNGQTRDERTNSTPPWERR